MCTNGWWIWTGKPVPASSTNDTGLAQQEVNNIKELMDQRDIMICDCAFRSLREEICLVTGWPSIRSLDPETRAWMREETRQVSDQRGNFNNDY